MQEKGNSPVATVVSDCEREDLKKYRPADEIVKALHTLFSEELIERITNLKRDLKPSLLSGGFTILQYPYSSKSAIVVEHPSLPQFILKFSRDPHTAAQGKYKEHLQIIKRRSLASRAINADRLSNFLREQGFKHVRVPQKFFCCVANKFPILLAEKLSLKTHRTLLQLDAEEIGEILSAVEFSRGTLDLWPRNIIVLDEQIQFIDLERQEEPTIWPSIIADSVKEFKEKIAPHYHALVDTWFSRVLGGAMPFEVKWPVDYLARKALKSAVVAEDAEKVRQLLKDNTFEGRRLDKLLFKAIESGNFTIVEILVENGANPHAENLRGFTSLDFAHAQGNPHIVSFLSKVQLP